MKSTRVAQELRREIGEVVEVKVDKSSNKCDISNISHIPQLTYNDCIVYLDTDYDCEFKYATSDEIVSERTIISNRFIGILCYDILNILRAGDTNYDLYIDTYKLKLIDPELARELISMVDNEYDCLDEFNLYNKSQLNTLRSFLSGVTHSSVSDIIKNSIANIDIWLEESSPYGLTGCMYVYNKGTDEFRNVATALDFGPDYIRGVCLGMIDGKLSMECHNRYTHKNSASSSYLYIDMIGLYRFNPRIVADIHKLYYRYVYTNTNWAEIPEDSSDTLFNVHYLRVLFNDYRPKVNNPCIEYLKGGE